LVAIRVPALASKKLSHSYASIAVGGAPLLYIGKLLGHTQAQTTGRYAHLANDPVKQVNDEVGRRIVGAMGGFIAEVAPFQKYRDGIKIA
jgi:hypothetical protein